MRRSASEIIRNLETRIARLEKQSASIDSLPVNDAAEHFIELIEDIETRLGMLEDIGWVRGFRSEGVAKELDAIVNKIYNGNCEKELHNLKKILESLT